MNAIISVRDIHVIRQPGCKLHYSGEKKGTKSLTILTSTHKFRPVVSEGWAYSVKIMTHMLNLK